MYGFLLETLQETKDNTIGASASSIFQSDGIGQQAPMFPPGMSPGGSNNK